jgi:hypothetical protein
VAALACEPAGQNKTKAPQESGRHAKRAASSRFWACMRANNGNSSGNNNNDEDD